MRNIYRIALVSVLAFSLAAVPSELNAQTRRANTTTASRSSSSDNKSATTTSSSTTASRSAAASTSRQTTTAPATTSSRQVNRNTGSTSTSRSGSTSNSSSTRSNTATRTTSGTSTSRSNSGTAASSGTTASRSSATTPSRTTTTTTSRSTTSGSSSTASRTVTAARQTEGTSASTQTSGTQRVTRSNANVTSSRGLTSAPAAEARSADTQRNGQAATSANKAARGNQPQLNYQGGNRGNMRMDDNRNLNRIPPRERDFMTYDKPGSFYSHAPHFFGYRIQTLPPRYRRISHWGIDYYYYDNIYYRRYGTYYVVCRPPFGVAIDIAIRDLAFATVRFSYYHNVYRTFDVIDDNYRTIAEQNRIIAQNNATIIAQNKALAINSGRATSAYEIAHALGLVQSYANINTEYYYEDGVFYTVNKNNRYEVIVPPAGALVDQLPDDYDTIVLNGVEYYKVDDTVYRLTLVDGIPALEVLGQMYGSMAKQYNYYYN